MIFLQRNFLQNPEESDDGMNVDQEVGQYDLLVHSLAPGCTDILHLVDLSPLPLRP